LFFVFVFQFRKKHRVSLKNLTIPQPCAQNQWFWDEVNMSGLTPLLTSGYENISHGFVCTMSKRWHEETNSFHLPVGEMTITLDDVACLLGIPITGRLLPDRELTSEEGLEMIQVELTAKAAAKEMTKQGAAHDSFGVLKRRYEELLNSCNQLLEPDTQEEQDERAQVRLACIKAFLMLLLGWTLFSCKIWTSWIAGHGVGWDLLSYMSSYLLPPTHLWWLHDLACGNICFSSFRLIGS